MELLHNLQHCLQIFMCTIHTHYIPALAVSAKWYVLTYSMCAFSPAVCLLLKVLRLIETWANFCWGRRKDGQVWQKHFSFGQAKYSASVIGTYAEAAKHVLVRGCGGIPLENFRWVLQLTNCHQTCTNSNSSEWVWVWYMHAAYGYTTRRINMVPSIHGRSGSCHMYLQYTGDMDVHRSDQTICRGFWSQKI